MRFPKPCIIRVPALAQDLNFWNELHDGAEFKNEPLAIFTAWPLNAALHQWQKQIAFVQ
jgi:hypothetical protein